MKTVDKKMAPRVGFEPTTKWLTATYSAIELPRNVIILILEDLFYFFRDLNPDSQRVGFESARGGLTATYSAIELPRKMM